MYWAPDERVPIYTRKTKCTISLLIPTLVELKLTLQGYACT